MGSKLNEKQQLAVTHKEGPMLVLAGPGSGKTTVILYRTKWLLETQKVRGNEILVVTFTKAAAMEMKARFPLKDSGVTFATFHSVFFRILREEFGYRVDQIILEDERRRLLRGFVEKTDWQIQDYDEYISSFLSEMSLMHNEMISYGSFEPENIPKNEFRSLYLAYDRYKENESKLDFDDMMTSTYELLASNHKVLEKWRKRFVYIMVDEFQDVNQVQYDCLLLLSAPKNNLFVVGDDDQSIYGFRGARPDFLLEFNQDFSESQQVILDMNYRSTDRIISMAKSLIGGNVYRFAKNQRGVRGVGMAPQLLESMDAVEEAQKIAEQIAKLADEENAPLDEMAVIYRTNIQAGVLVRALYQRGIPYVLKDNASHIYDHWIAKDLLAYLHLAENEESDASLRRIINKPKRYISKELQEDAERMPYNLFRSFFVCPTLKKWQEEQLQNLRQDLVQLRKRKPYEAILYARRVIGYDEFLEEYAAYRHSSAQVLTQIADEITQIAKESSDVKELERILDELSTRLKEEQRKTKDKKKGVMLMTMHSAKGLEFENVFLPSVMQGIIPHEKSLEGTALEEERRLFYVAITRAKDRLILSTVKEKYTKTLQTSIFLDEIGLKGKT